jgi:hypothetical protein
VNGIPVVGRPDWVLIATPSSLTATIAEKSVPNTGAEMTVSDAPGGWVAGLSDVLARLAAPVETQLDYLTKLGVGPVADELGLEFDDLFAPLRPELVDRADWVRAVQELDKVDAALNAPGLDWGANALASAPEWENIRRIASKAGKLVEQASISCPLPNSGSVSASKIIRGD